MTGFVRRNAPLAMAFAFALGIGVTILWMQLASQEQAGKTASGALPGIRPFDAIFDPSQPLMVDEREPTTFLHAVNRAEFTIATPQYLPQEAQGSPQVWYSDSSGEVALRYGDRLVIEYVPWVSDLSPAEEYQQMVKEWGAGEARDLSGHPAWVVPAGTVDTSDPSVSEVYVAVNGVEVTLHGRIPIEELVKVAESLAPVGKVATGGGD